MEVVAFSPFGLLSQETGFLALLTNYLRGRSFDLSWLRCNGLFSLCDRDSEANWRRSIDHCTRCMSDHTRVASWAEIPLRDLSGFLNAEEVSESRRWIFSLPSAKLFEACFRGELIYPLCEESIRSRCGQETPDLRNQTHEQLVRRIMMSCVRMLMLSERYAEATKPYLALVAGGKDFISRAFVNRLRAQDLEVVLLNWDLSARSVKITHPRRPTEFSCPLIFEDITAMRSDYRTWPKELVTIVEDVCTFLDLSGNQLALPITRVAR